MDSCDVAVVGAGAAGLMAAIAAARESGGRARVVALDGATRIGAKILISGGGRCNVTHERVEPEDFNGSSRNAVAKILRTFTVPQTIAFFRDIGVALKREETGKLFPVTDRARTVLDALLGTAAEAGAEVRPGWRVDAVRATEDGFVLEGARGTLGARRVVLATGGRSVPKTGSDGAGYDVARAFGHSIVAPFPALVPLVLPSDHWMTSLRGTSAEVEIRVPPKTTIRGAMLFTHFGVSGPAVLDASRHWIAAGRNGDVVASLLPGVAPESLDAEIVATSQARPRLEAGHLFRDRLPERLAEAIVEHGAGEDPRMPLARLSREARRRIVAAVLALPIPAVRERGWDFAEVTAGGVPLAELRLATMESRLQAGLYLCGEILDVDGRIGGFNFQWAWASGRLAGGAAARYSK
ncbi:MAG: NAD(P)/FAD-dependent oxidoreductase [Thermoanaerobaculia bacterium]